jgi:H+/Cl- antiporter ClcA
MQPGQREPAPGLRHASLSRSAMLSRLHYKLLFWLFLTVLGVCAALTSLGTDLLITYLRDARARLILRLGPAHLVGRIAWTVAFALAAHGCVRVCPQCAGSGIPELKQILSSAPSIGSSMGYLSRLTLVCKLVGTLCVQGAGLSAGREGPFVHISACVASLLAPSWIANSPRHFAAVLRAASAAGVSFTFGAPVGGLLFAAETSVTYFRVSHLPRALLCALSGLLAVSWLNYGSLAPFKASAIEPASALTPTDAAAMIGLGVVCACFASGFNKALRALLVLRERHASSPAAQVGAVLTVAVATALLASSQSPARLLGRTPDVLLPALFDDSVPGAHGLGELGPGGWGAAQLCAAALAKLTLTALTIVLPIPCGLFTPVFVAGAFVGRGWALLLRGWLALELRPGRCALVGAAALTGSVTGTISSALIALELTGLGAGELTPIGVACVFSIALRGLSIVSVYDVIAEQRRLPGHALLMKRVHLGATPASLASEVSVELGRKGGGGGGGSGGGECYTSTLTVGDVVRAFEQPIPRVSVVCELGALREAAAWCAANNVAQLAIVERGAPGAMWEPLLPPREESELDERLVGTVSVRALQAYLRLGRSEREHSDESSPQSLRRPSLEQRLLEEAAGRYDGGGADDEDERLCARRHRLEIDLRAASAKVRGALVVNWSPFIVAAELSLGNVINIFQMLELSQCFVTASGWYLGTLTREGLSMALSQLDVAAAARERECEPLDRSYRAILSSASQLDQLARSPNASEAPSPIMPRAERPAAARPGARVVNTAATRLAVPGGSSSHVS